MGFERTDAQNVYIKDLYKVAFEVDKRMYPEAKIPQIFTVQKTMGAGEKESQMLGIASLDRHTTTSQDINFESGADGWEFYGTPHTFSKGISINFEAQEDSFKIKNLLEGFVKRLSYAAFTTKETFAARVFNNGGALSGDYVFNGSHPGNTDSSGNLMYDSKPLFACSGNDRTTKGGQTYYNSYAGLSLNAANFITLWKLHKVTNAKGELGEQIVNPLDTLLINPIDSIDAERLIETKFEMGFPNTQLNDANVLGNKVNKIIRWDYLDVDEAAWFLGKAQHPDFIFLERMAPQIDYFRDKSNLAYKASYVTRFGVWIKDWRCWTRGGGTSS